MIEKKIKTQSSDWLSYVPFPFRTCLHEGGGPQVGEVKCGGSPHLSCKRDQIKMRDYMDRRVTPPKRVTSPTWGTPPPCKQALSLLGLKCPFAERKAKIKCFMI